MNLYRRFGKRALDLLLLFIVSPVALFLLVVVWLAVRVTSGRPVLFRQTRLGLAEQPFLLCKFCTMREPPDGDYRALSDAQRLTRVGRWLRKTSLDELPQLWNILRGDISFVGPRPLLDFYLPRYTARQRRRHTVPAGITGWAQVNGRNALSWEQKFDYDIWYVEHQTLWLDVKILVLTLKAALSSRNISAPNHATCQEFLGSKS